MANYRKRTDVDMLLVPGHGRVRAGEVIRGEFDHVPGLERAPDDSAEVSVEAPAPEPVTEPARRAAPAAFAAQKFKKKGSPGPVDPPSGGTP